VDARAGGYGRDDGFWRSFDFFLFLRECVRNGECKEQQERERFHDATSP
jgi:hypothetical protein